MARPRIKVCCIASEAEARLAAEAGADLLGLVGPMPSGPGVLDLALARRIAAAAPPWARPVLLSAATTATEITAEAEAAGVDMVQAVRPLAEAQAAALAASGLSYIQVVHIEGQDALAKALRYGALCDALLLDSGRVGADVLGGTGQRHDWSLSAEIVRRAPCPVFLAGGLDPGCVVAALAEVAPFGLDVCSGLRPGGALDPALLTAFVAAAGTGVEHVP
ncbi:MAG: phosphoribosylanthranilate isomerase [Pseudomonadota bacterium]